MYCISWKTFNITSYGFIFSWFSVYICIYFIRINYFVFCVYRRITSSDILYIDI